MHEIVTISQRGTITIPMRIRVRFGLKANDQMVVEETTKGLLLRPAVCVPLELYSDQRISEFVVGELEVAKLLRPRKHGRRKAGSRRR